MRYAVKFVAILCIFFVPFIGCKQQAPETSQELAELAVKPLFIKNLSEFERSLAVLDSLIAQAKEDSSHAKALQEAFKHARLAYKRMEFLLEYYAPSTSEAMNGPALEEVGEEYKIEQPAGFQVLEEFLFPEVDFSSREAMLAQVKIMRSLCKRLDGLIIKKPLTDNRILDAMRLEIARVITLGITGFDSPVALYSIHEAKAALEGLAEAFAPYTKALEEKNPAYARQLDTLFSKAIAYLATYAHSFDSFNRLEFIVDFANPLSRALFDAQLALGIPILQTERVFRTTAKTLFDHDALNPLVYTPNYQDSLNPKQVELGHLLFFEPLLSINGKRSCASCHQPEKAFTDGLPCALTLTGNDKILRNTPTVINSAYQASSSYDQKTVYLEDRVRFVVHSPDEMNHSLDSVAKILAQSEDYRMRFKEAFGGENAVTAEHIVSAISSYMRSLSSFNSRFDEYMRGDKTKMNAQEQRGFNLFAGKAKCATCHFIPLFNGTVPPTFQETEAEVIGVPKEAKWKQAEIDPDIGKMAINGIELNKYMFKTPTLRNIELTAPYMHNGVYKTLDEVMRFYNMGGGKGIGIDLANQTLPPDTLGLTQAEIQDIIAFMKTLTDTTGLTQRPRSLPKFSNDVLSSRMAASKY
jgi:cytochrome c peroxidase